MQYALGMRDVRVELDGFTLGPLDLDLKPGRVVGLVGPNGSGKTTTMRTIMGMLDHEQGSIEVCDRPAGPRDGRWKEDVGYVPDRPVFYDWMRGAEFLGLEARFYPRWDDALASDLGRRFRLDLGTRIRVLSAGNRVKLALVSALAHRPALALFDEPTAGLDPVVRSEVFAVLGSMMESEGMTVFYSTHILDDLHRLADELVFLAEGRVRMHVDKDDLLDAWRRIRCQFTGDLPPMAGVVEHTRQGRVHELVTPDGERTLAELSALGAEAVRLSPLTLEEIAVHVMKEAEHGRDA